MADTHELAVKDYILGMSYQAIADKYNVSINTVKSWKVRYGWERDKPVKGTKKGAHKAHKNEKVCTQNKKDAEPDEPLSDKEQLFCYHFIRTRNATQAALLSGYSKNKASAQVQSSRLMQRDNVKQEIERLRLLVKQELHIEAMDVLQQYAKIAFADIGDYVSFGQRDRQVIGMYGPLVVKDDEGNEKPIMETINFVDMAESALVDTSVLSEVKQGKDGIGIKLADKMKALEKLELYLDLLPDQWKRKVETEKLEIERKKIEIAEKKISDENADKSVTMTIKVDYGDENN